ncbi:hypothetical protein SAMN05421543_106113 [Alicyclobacillus macrosporangiidus]|uniref:Uncharacterized protein n=1 Tax=Alicyclobacillus macrosporangiidus TaxID=392015 RepID=A0A1I7IBA9_9BACL|nr:hypothetical protein SAMN05421543_106113 [Alicyclobacillus macrosporangiidus]
MVMATAEQVTNLQPHRLTQEVSDMQQHYVPALKDFPPEVQSVVKRVLARVQQRMLSQRAEIDKRISTSS